MKFKKAIASILAAAMVCSSVVYTNPMEAQAASSKLKKITMSSAKASVYKGQTKQLKVVKAPASAKAEIKWSSSDKKVATVTKDGLVKGVKPGTATIKATAKVGKKTLSTKCNFTVKKPTYITKITPKVSSKTLKVGKKFTIKTTIAPENASVKKLKYSTSNKKVATVTSKGVVTAKGKGTAKITIKATDGSKESATVKITASAVPVTKVTLKPAQVSLSIGMAKQLKVSVKPAKATNRNVTYTSSNENVASVSSAGVLTAKATGTAAITATAQDGSKKSSTVSVTVNPVMAANVAVTPASLALKTGASQKLQTVVSPANTTNKNVSYTSSAPDVASVSSDGTVTAKGKGSAVITVTTQDGSNKQASVRVSVSDVEVKIADLAVVENDLVLAPGEAKQITANITPANATNQTLRYTSSDSNAAEVSETGVITAKAQGSAVITVETTDGSNKKAEIKVEVTNKDKVRTIVTTDGEVDDMDSFMRLMLYSNEMDLAGLILTSSTYHYAGDPDKGIAPKRWTGTAWAGEVLEDYSEVYSNLTVHSADYPTPAYLESILKIGNIKNVGEMDEITEGSEFMKEILLDDDDRTLYIQTWGGTNTTARALKSIEEEYKGTDQWEAIQQKIYDKAVIYIILNQDATYSNYIAKNWPGIKVINDGGNFWRFAYMWKSVPEPLTLKLQGDWNYNNIKTGHGPLLENYKLMGDGTILEGEDANEQRGSEDYLIKNTQYNRYDFISEGDSPSFFYLLDTGLRSMEDPTYGGWGGRFGVEADGTYKNTVSDYNIYTQKEDKTYTLTRWFNDIQGDFAARADWCVADEFSDANHRPTVTVEEGLDLTAQPGERVKLHADGADPDGDLLTYKWWQYYEADTYKGTEDGKFKIIGGDSNVASFVVPADAKDGDTIHMVVQVTDDGAHNMNHYQRVILTVAGAQQVESVTVNGDSEIQAGSKTTLNAVVLPETLTNKNVTWKSDNEAVANVTDKGQVTGVSVGTATITAVSKVDNTITGTFEITVTRAANDPANQNPRAIITQDAEVDDQNSLVHALLYANEIDFQGIIQTSSKFHWIGDPDAADAASQTKYRWPGTDWMNEYADDYEAVYENLRTHDPNYPTPAYIRSIIKIGNIGYKGEVKNETEGSKLVEKALLDNDPRKLYLMAWGGTNTITRALMSIEEKYKDTDEWAAIREKIVNKSMICAFGKQDQTYDEYIGEEWPEILFLNVGGGTTYGYSWSKTAGSVDSEGKRTLSGAWMRENLDYGHGALLDNYVTWGDGTYLDGEEDGSQFGTNENLLDSTNWWGRMKYQRYDFLSEGDSPSFFYLMDTGLRSLEDPAFGSYGGRYYLDTSMKNSKGQQLNWYKTVQDYDPLQDKKVNSDWRWMADLQHEFATRADWCITPNYDDANHAPALSIKEGLDFTAKPGETLKLHAEASDPDGDYVSVKWSQYFEADTYVEPEANKGIYIKGANSDMATITVPEDAKEGDTLIILVQASDNGTHSLSHYQEILITVEGAQAVESVIVEGASEVEVGNKVTLNAVVLPETLTNKNVTWKSDNEAVATVSDKGQVTGVSFGTANITAVSQIDKTVAGTFEIKVTRAKDDANSSKVRTIVTTDGEVDDMDSFMRLMLYSNEMDIAGLILSSSTYHYAGDPDKGIAPKRWTGTVWAGEVLDDYEEVYENLKVHSPDFPAPEYLKSILKIGNIKNVGEMEEITEGSEFMKDILLDDDDRTLYIQTWGGTNTTARALKSIEEEYKGTDQWDEIQQKIYDKAVIYIILNQDATYSDYIAKQWPGIRVINDGGNFWQFAYMWKRVAEPLTAKLQGDWYYNNIKTGHGALLANYKLMGDGTILEGEDANEQRGSEDYLLKNPQYNRYDFISEGDSPSFFYLLDTGLRSLEDPTYGGWGGRFGVMEDGTYKNTVKDYNVYTNSQDTAYTLTRWFNDIQSDFAARADWCIASDYADANHMPSVSVKEGIDLSAAPGERLKLHAEGSDPDGDKLTYKWWQYYEADTYDGTADGNMSVTGKNTDTASFVIPEDAQNGDTIHMVIQVTDNGAHNLNYYQRVIITVTGREEIQNVEIKTPQGVDANAIALGTKTAGKGGSPYAVQLTAEVTPALTTGKTFTWSSSDVSVATVDSTGKVTPLTAGSVRITAAANDGSGKEASIDLTIVELKPSAVEVTSGGSTKLYVNATLSLNAFVNPTDAVDKSVTWTSDNENVAIVSQDGVVTGIGAGTVVISAVSNADQSVFGEITLVVEEENVNRRSAPVTEDASEVSTEAEEVQEDVIREEVPNVENQNEETQNEETQTEVSSNGETQL